MKRSARSKAGMTLIELLAAVSVSLLIIGAIYTVFLSGIRAYERIGIENELRSEADYAMAMVMNKLYEFAPDGINLSESGEKTLTFIDDRQKRVDPSSGFVDEREIGGGALTVSIENGSLIINGEAISPPHLLLVDNSAFSVRCLREERKEEARICRSGVITIRLAVQDRKHADPDSRLYVRPFTLKTEFGF
ncbi:hypothetical protein M493_13650 [Geobacillus genomosp. 3]|uniref:Tfp pilus assembly protein n=1 Tax=Geobacillus genomosp. 3 TaxID=1921421 RepID=S6A3B9_GEOG3|nr:prepilin-type N-terminal cleavage/methylation domain-containing protein [Geobacillus genomosp. 3]AGT32971.1 hypothetical protein M493_13650 [Geobacillus genomosp. 3]ASS86719.1 Tfp pilus assembly protein [Geobacillus lituanicus]